MKKITIIFLIQFLGSIIFAQDFAPIGSIWHYDYINLATGSCIGVIEVSSIKDTLIENKDCRVLRSEIDMPCVNPPVPVEEFIFHSDSNKVFLYLNSEFHLINDFSMELGDSILVKIRDTNGNGPNEMANPFYAKVTEIDSLEVNGNYLRTWTLTNTSYLYFDKQIEKIGNLNWFFFVFDLADDIKPSYLRCYEDLELGLYESESIINGFFEDCSATKNFVSTSGIEKEEIKIFPNPTSEELVILNIKNEKLDYEIYSINGNRMKFGIIDNEEESINLIGFPNGIYIFRTVYKGSKVRIQRFMKL